MRPFMAEFFVFKLFTYHIAPEPVLYMCVSVKKICHIRKFTRGNFIRIIIEIDINHCLIRMILLIII